jgi:hypothetical protein
MGQVASNVEGVPATPQKITNVRATPPVIEDPSFDNDSVSGDEQSNGPVNVVSKSRGPPKPETTIPKMKKGKIRKFKEDEIDQDQENRDLLAYMQIVGENASQLPYTWRDDPLLGRTVSTLTAKEYAKKADAFIPCDIRVIGSTSNALDRTVEREISDNMNIGTKVCEPGKSKGGAVCNALLKALYDFENGDDNALEGESDNFDYNVGDNLFDDDDASIVEDSSFGSLQFEETAGTATLTWSSLIRKMKDEMEDQEYELVPTLTTSRKFDLSEPVHLLPFDFDPKLNRKFSLFVGCNYKGQYGELKNSHNDVKVMKDYIVNVHGFPEDKDYMTILIDDGKHKKPTHQNILLGLKEIALRSRPGDAVFIQFSGHGGRILDAPSSGDTYDETFVPVDYNRRGLISEKSIIRSLLVRMAEDVTVTMLLDSCDTGFVFDMPYSWETRTDESERHAKLSLNDNFSLTRFLDVVTRMYDSNPDEDQEYGGSDDEDDDDEAFVKKTNVIGKALGATLRDVAQDAETELKAIAKKTHRIVNKMVSAAKEEVDNEKDDRNERSFDESDHDSRNNSYDDSFDDSDDDDSSDDSYEGRIARNYNY